MAMQRPRFGSLPPFLQNVLVILGGAVGAQLIVLICTPLLTRLYPVEAFGIAQAFTAASATLLFAGCLRYDAALTAAPDEDIDPLILVCLVVGVIMSAVTAAAVTFVGPQVLRKLGLGGLKHVNLLFAIGMTVAVAGNALTYLLIRAHSFNSMSKGRIAQPVVFLVTALVLGAASFGTLGLVAADICGRGGLALIFMFYYLKGRKTLGLRAEWRRLRAVLWRYRLFPLVSMPGGVISTIGLSFNTIWMLALFDVKVAGAYALVERTAVMPTGAIASAVGQVYQGQLSHALQTGSAFLRRGFHNVLVGQIKLAAVPTLIVFVIAPWAFPVIFGDKYFLAGSLCQAILPLIFASYLAAPFHMVLVLMERQRAQISWEIARVLVIAATWYFVHLAKLPPVPALRIISGLSALSYVVFLLICEHELLLRERENETAKGR